LKRDRERLAQLHRRLLDVRLSQSTQSNMRLERLHARLLAQHPRQRLVLWRQQLDQHFGQLRRSIEHKLERDRLTMQQTARTLHAVSPLATLERGYAILFDEQGKVLRSTQHVAAGTSLRARLADGELPLKVGDD
jgi:exodeoxyribonuclease VII large subunit